MHTTFDQTANGVAALLLAILTVHFSNSYFSYAFGLFFLYFLYDWIRARRGKNVFHVTLAPIRPVVLGMVLFYGAILAASALLGDGKSVGKAVDAFSLAIPFFMLYILGARHDIGRGSMWGVLAGSLIICIGGFLLPQDGGRRMVSFFAHPNHFGTALAMLLPFVIYNGYRAKGNGEKILCALLSLVMLYCLVRTESRGAMMALAAAVAAGLVCTAFQMRRSLPRRTLMLAGCVVVISFALGLGAVYHVSSERTGLGVIGGERLFMLESSWHMWRDHPLLGVGLANWGDAYYSAAYHPTAGTETNLSMAHNMPVHFFATAGLLGGAGYLAFVFLFFVSLYRSLASARDKCFAFAGLTAFLAFTVQGLVDTTILNKIPARLFFALMGWELAAVVSQRKSGCTR